MHRWTFELRRAEDEAPLVGARVALGLRFGRREGTLVTATTDAAGRCELTAEVPPERAFSVALLADAPGRSALHLYLGLPSQREPFVAHLAPGPTLRGRVVDLDGAPIAGATVRKKGKRVSAPLAFGKRTWPPPVVTDSGGRFVDTWFSAGWRSQPEGEHLSLLVEHPGHEPTGVPELDLRLPGTGTTHLEVALAPRTGSRPRSAALAPDATGPEPCGRLRLRITGAAAGGRVAVRLADCAEYAFFLPIADDGSTPECEVVAGTYRISVMVPGYAVRHTTLNVTPSPRTHTRTVRLRRGRRVTGRVTDARGAPVADCQVQLASTRAWTTPEATATTDAAGHYTLEGAHGACWLHFAAEGLLPAHRVRWIPRWLPWPARLDVQLGRGCTIRGVVVDGQGRPKPGAFVQLHSHGPGPQLVCGYATSADEGGCFVLPHMPPGRAKLRTLDASRDINCTEASEIEVELRAR